MSRRRYTRRKKVQRARRFSIGMFLIAVSFLLSVFFCNYKVVAEKPTSYKYYTEVRVDRNDTLWSIADRYMTEEYRSKKEYVREVQKINNLGLELQYGQKILVPYYSDTLR